MAKDERDYKRGCKDGYCLIVVRGVRAILCDWLGDVFLRIQGEITINLNCTD